MDDLAVVVITRDRRDSLLRTLQRLVQLPERPDVVVVDNGSHDGTADAVREVAAEHPQVRLVVNGRNLGALGRNLGVEQTDRPFVAFCDDDSWWQPGSLPRAARLLADHPDVGLLAATVRQHPDGAIDRVSVKMRAARLGDPAGAPGPAVLSFPAFAAVVRVAAFRAVGGFHPLLFFGGEERLLALDLAAAGWGLHHADTLVAWHATGDRELAPERWAQQERNDRLVDWMRAPVGPAALGTARLARRAVADPTARLALRDVLRRLPAALRQRRPVPPELADAMAREDAPLTSA